MFLGPGDQFQQLLKGTPEGPGVTEMWTSGPGAHLLGCVPGEPVGEYVQPPKLLKPSAILGEVHAVGTWFPTWG